MKTKFFILGVLAAAATAFISCDNKEIDINIAPVSVSEGVPFEITLNAPDTKNVCNDLVTSWMAGDAANVFHAVAGTTNYVNDGMFSIEENNSSKFKGTLAEALDPTKAYDWYIFYPYGSYITTPENTEGYTFVAPFINVQNVSGNTEHLIRIPLAGKATSLPGEMEVSASMKHMTSIFKVVVNNNSGAVLPVKTVAFKAPVKVVGNYCINFVDPQNPTYSIPENVTSQSDSVTVRTELAINNGSQATFYFATKPYTAEANAKMMLYVNDFLKTNILSAERVFSPGKIYTLNFNYTQPQPMASLPFQFSGGTSDAAHGKADLMAMTGVTASGLGSDYSASSAPFIIKLDTNGDYIQVRYNEPADYAQLQVKINGTNNASSSIRMSGSADGINFTDIQTFNFAASNGTTMEALSTNAINTSYRFLRFTFTKGSGNNLGLGFLAIWKPSTDPVLSVKDVNDFSPVGGNGNTTYSVKNFSDDVKVDSFTGCVTAASASAGNVSFTLAPNYSYQKATGTIVLKSASKAVSATINVSQLGSNLMIDNKTTKTQEILIPYDKTSITASVLSDYFGWSAEVTPAESMNLSLSPTSGSASLEAGSVTISSTTAGAADVLTLGTIVFKRIDEDTQTRTVTVKKDAAPSGNYYTKVTSITSGGKYLLVSEYGETKYICSGLIVSNALPLVKPDISSNKIASNTTVDTYAVTITSVSGGYTIVNSDGKYFVLSSDLKSVTLGTSAPATPWTLTKHTDNSFIFVNAEKNGANDGSTRSIFIGNSGKSCKYYASTNFGKTNYATTYLTLYKYQ